MSKRQSRFVHVPAKLASSGAAAAVTVYASGGMRGSPLDGANGQRVGWRCLTAEGGCEASLHQALGVTPLAWRRGFVFQQTVEGLCPPLMFSQPFLDETVRNVAATKVLLLGGGIHAQFDR